ncbi:MAG: MotA/TolQ/ExbB proton channel family protein [Bacteroidetes bacterium]|jgi:motA/tolQ/exbB proton channel family protein|nr:MAG: MotA/TolQ/ExbB proton channel family protein [Bacteroidota bacterium]
MLLQVPAGVQDTVHQAVAAATQTLQQPVAEVSDSYFTLLLKGGWILLPLFLLFALSIYVIIERMVVLKTLGKTDSVWFARIKDLVYEYKFDSAEKFCQASTNSYSKVVEAGLGQVNNDIEAVQTAMQGEATQQIARMEKHLNWLSITASVAPMLGFLGTIFGVINIFFRIAQTNEFEISTIADGLYQKMVSSAVGLFVGIVAYAGYYLLNGRIDTIVANMDKYSNDLVNMLRGGGKK